MMISGLGVMNLRKIEVDENQALRPELLQKQIKQDRAAGHLPFFVCATIGTTSSNGVDDLSSIAEIAPLLRPKPLNHERLDCANGSAKTINDIAPLPGRHLKSTYGERARPKDEWVVLYGMRAPPPSPIYLLITWTANAHTKVCNPPQPLPRQTWRNNSSVLPDMAPPPLPGTATQPRNPRLRDWVCQHKT